MDNEYNLTIGVDDTVSEILETLEEISSCSGYRVQQINLYFRWADKTYSLRHRAVETDEFHSLEDFAKYIYNRGDEWLHDHLRVPYISSVFS